MLIVYKFWTPDQVTILEALLTLAFLPAMVTIAYIINVRPWKAQRDSSEADNEAEAALPDAAEVAPLEAGCAQATNATRLPLTNDP